jgi:hypothetical protein
MRRALGITDESLLQVTLEGDHILIAPLRSSSDDNLRLYTDEEIAEFLEEDKISPDLAMWVQSYVKRRKQGR